jgi:hypothetical protein
MCLTLNDTEIRIAEEDIICYKVFVKQSNTLISPYQKMCYKCGTMYVSETPMIVKHGKGLLWQDIAYVEEGFHSFSYKKEAECLKQVLSNLSTNAGFNYVVVKCLIPVGTRYAVGVFYDFGWFSNSLCSERIIAVEEV